MPCLLAKSPKTPAEHQEKIQYNKEVAEKKFCQESVAGIANPNPHFCVWFNYSEPVDACERCIFEAWRSFAKNLLLVLLTLILTSVYDLTIQSL